MGETYQNPTNTQWAQMHSTTRLKKSRELWKSKSRAKSATIKNAKRTIKRVNAKVEALTKNNEDLASRLMQAENLDKGRISSNLMDINAAYDIREICVLLAIVAVISFRAVPRVLRVFNKRGPKFHWIPHFTSVINWTFRVGLSRLRSIVPIDKPWIALIDCTIDIGFKKALIVLRVLLSTLQEKGSAVGLADCECIGVEVGSEWNGDSICESLDRIFSVSGRPVAILKDGGTDLNRGVKLWREKFEAKRVVILDDLGHAMANALKAMYGKSNVNHQYSPHSHKEKSL